MKTSTYRWLAIVAVMTVSFGVAACDNEPRAEAEEAGDSGPAMEASDEQPSSDEAGEHERSEGGDEHARSEGGGEHGDGEEGGEHGSEGEGEESGEYIGRGETWDKTRRGARLVLSFDPAANGFVGTVENTTGRTLCAVRVEVHLAGGTELGPTERMDVPSGETITVELPTEREAFDTCTAHPEVSRCTGE